MIPLAIAFGLMGMFAMKRAHRFCHSSAHGCGGGSAFGSYGPWGPSCGSGHGGHGRHGERGRHGGRRRWMLRALLGRIDAMPAQERVIVEQIDKLEQRVHDARSHLGGARGDLAAALRTSTLDDAALGAVLGHIDLGTSELRTAAIDALRAIHAVLDDKQRAELATLLDRSGGAAWFRGAPYR